MRAVARIGEDYEVWNKTSRSNILRGLSPVMYSGMILWPSYWGVNLCGFDDY